MSQHGQKHLAALAAQLAEHAGPNSGAELGCQPARRGPARSAGGASCGQHRAGRDIGGLKCALLRASDEGHAAAQQGEAAREAARPRGGDELSSAVLQAAGVHDHTRHARLAARQAVVWAAAGCDEARARRERACPAAESAV